MTTFTCHSKVYQVMSEHVHWLITMQDHAQINNIYIHRFQFLVYSGLAQAHPELYQDRV